jgi:hypothetical protein
MVWRISKQIFNEPDPYVIYVYRRDGDVFTKLPDLEDPLVSFFYDMK